MDKAAELGGAGGRKQEESKKGLDAPGGGGAKMAVGPEKGLPPLSHGGAGGGPRGHQRSTLCDLN